MRAANHSCEMGAVWVREKDIIHEYLSALPDEEQ